ncbi:MAG TPA: polysaccharide biosynthesis/export family protein [Gemmatimonadaceae bacterium]
MNRLSLFVLSAALIVASSAAAQTTTAAAHAVEMDTAQLVRPGDVVRLRIWREPDLSGDFPVNEWGIVVLPKIGDMQVSTTTPASLRDSLRQRYGAYLRDAAIEVTVLKRLTILGAVVHAGVFPVDPTMTVGDVIALSGGSTPLGSPTDAYLIRDGVRVPVHINLSDRIADLPVRSGDQVYVPERSWISRNAQVVAASIAAFTTLIVALYIRR